MTTGEQPPTPDPIDRTSEPDARADERSSLRRELLAILFLYAAGAVLPLLIGLAFGPESTLDLPPR